MDDLGNQRLARARWPGEEYRGIEVRDLERGIQYALHLLALRHDAVEVSILHAQRAQLRADPARELLAAVQLLAYQVQLGEIALRADDVGDVTIVVEYRHGIDQQRPSRAYLLVDRDGAPRPKHPRGGVVVEVSALEELADRPSADVGPVDLVQPLTGPVDPEQAWRGVTDPDAVRHRLEHGLELARQVRPERLAEIEAGPGDLRVGGIHIQN